MCRRPSVKTMLSGDEACVQPPPQYACKYDALVKQPSPEEFINDQNQIDNDSGDGREHNQHPTARSGLAAGCRCGDPSDQQPNGVSQNGSDNRVNGTEAPKQEPRQRDQRQDNCEPDSDEEVATEAFAKIITCFWQYARPDNGRFLRHRPERSERCLNYEKLYQGQPALTKLEGVPKAPA